MFAPKLEHLVGEFSRARNKRYESNVVNRIWGPVCDLPLRPRTQMYAKVRNELGNAHRRFIDLCFPEVGLAIECDGQQHAQQAEEDAEREREIQASDVLDGLFSGGLEFRRVVVHDRSWEDVERQIEEVAGDVRARAGKRGIRAKMAGAEDRAWSFLDPVRCARAGMSSPWTTPCASRRSPRCATAFSGAPTRRTPRGRVGATSPRPPSRARATRGGRCGSPSFMWRA